MQWLENWNVKTRLLLSFAVVLLFMGITIALGVASGQRSLAGIRGIVEQELVKFEIVSEIDSATKGNARNTLELFLVSPAQRPAIRQRMADTRKRLDTLFEKLEPMLLLPEGQRLFAETRARRQTYVAAFSKAATTLEQGDEALGRQLLSQEVLPAIDALAAPINGLLNFQKTLANQRGEDLARDIGRQNLIATTLGAIALLVGVSSALLLIGSIMRPLNTAMDATREMAKGNLAVALDVRGDNEFSHMLRALQAMQASLSQTMGQIQDSANSVSSASQQISAANQDLSARTESQASALEQTAASMEEINSTVQQNMQVTQTASRQAEEASHHARQVGELVGNVVVTMAGIHTSSQRIHDIIGVIDSIAFQTNILALNAAVEAARAGEQGRGFAVVASEVRSLAHRSATAAQEIKAIIQDNVAKMQAGNAEVEQAGQSVRVVVSAIEQVSTTVSAIALSTREQTSGIAQVNQAVDQLDQSTQQNAALVEETAAASQNLNDQVKTLTEVINRFHVSRASGTELVYRA